MRRTLEFGLLVTVLALPAVGLAQDEESGDAGTTEAEATETETEEAEPEATETAAPAFAPVLETGPDNGDGDPATPANEEEPRFGPIGKEGPREANEPDDPLQLQSAGPGALGANLLDAIDLRWSGYVQSELHYRIEEKTAGSGFYDEAVLPEAFSRNENTLNLKLAAATGRFTAIADVDFDWLGFAERVDELGSLSRRSDVSPVRLETHALYLEAVDLGLEGLDLRVGQQVVQWGFADQFNPTNNLNPNDLENILYFGRQVANLMGRLDYSVSDMWSVSGVVVPVFKPAVLPATGRYALTSVDRLPFLEEELRWRLHSQREFAQELGYATRVSKVNVVLPESRLANAQWAIRIAGPLFGQDLAVSYYEGRTDVPVPVQNHTRDGGVLCNPDDEADCVNGILDVESTLRFPKMRVLGFNLAGELDLLGWASKVFQPLGYRVEFGVYFPRKRDFRITQDTLLGGLQPAGEMDYGLEAGRRPLVVDSEPFAKWTLGIDYSVSRFVYVNLMWVHGLFDEFGAGDFIHRGDVVRKGGVRDPRQAVLCFEDGSECATETLHPRLGDYLVAGLDFRFMDSKMLLRLFVLWDLNGYTDVAWDDDAGKRVDTHHSFYSELGRSAIVYPELQYNVGEGLMLSGGALLQFGEDYTKFGDPAAGGSVVWGRATFSY